MTTKGDTLPGKLPPTPRAAYYHSLRVHLQAMTWESMGEINLDLLEWSWKLNENSLVPIMADLDPAPSHLLQFVRCKCKTKKRCSTSLYSCHKHGLKCVSSCGAWSRLVNENHAIVLTQAGTQANQFASAVDCTGNITNFNENHAGKSFFFSKNSKEACPLIFVSVIRKVKP